MTLRRLAALLAAGCAMLVTADQAAAAGPPLAVLGEGGLTVHAEQGSGSAVAYVTVLNSGDRPASIAVTFQAASSGSVKARVAGSPEVGPDQAKRVRLAFTGLKKLEAPVSGQLVITGGEQPVAQSVEVVPALQPAADWPTLIPLISFGIALLVTLIVAVATVIDKDFAQLGTKAPAAEWSFESWATHLVGIGAILGTVLGTASLPATPRQIDQTSLISLSLLFGAIVVVAPFVYQAIQSPSSSSAPPTESGYTWVLLLACGLTLGAVLGELATLALAAWEITGGGTGGVAIEVGLAVLALLAIYYLAVTAWNAATADWKQEAQTKRTASAEATEEAVRAAAPAAAAAGTNVVVIPPEAPRASWTLP